MYANLYGLPRCGLPFADLRGNSREIIIRNFHCQFVHLVGSPNLAGVASRLTLARATRYSFFRLRSSSGASLLS